MYKRQFDKQAISFAIEWIESENQKGSAPLFMRADLPGEWLVKNKKLFSIRNRGPRGRTERRYH